MKNILCVCTKYSQLPNDLYLKLENAMFPGLSNEIKLLQLVKYKLKQVDMFMEKDYVKRT